MDGEHNLTPLLVSKKKAADLLGISPRSVEYLIAAGEIPTVKIGARRLIAYSNLKTFARRDHVEIQKDAE